MTAEVLLATSAGVLALGDDNRELLAGADVTSLVDGEDGVLWAVVGQHDLHRVEASSVELAASTEASISCVQAHAGTVWCGIAGARLLRLVDDRLDPVPSFDAAPTHADWYTPWGGPPTVWSMASSGPRLYVNVHVGGILVTTDFGDHWTATIDLHDDVHQVRVGADGTLWAATGAGGLARSGDGGTTWSSRGDDLPEPYLRSMALVPDGVIVGGSVGPHATGSSLYKFDDAGGVRRLGDGLPDHLGGNVDAYRLASKGPTVVVADPEGPVYRSTDGGESWSTLVDAPPQVHAVVVR